MLRRLFTVASAVSLLLWVATVVLWALSFNNRSFWLADPLGGLRVTTGGGTWQFGFFEGYLCVRHFLAPTAAVLPDVDRSFRLGKLVGYTYLQGGLERSSMTLVSPWVIVGLAAILPCCWLLTALRTRSGHRGTSVCCRVCSYNLTANTSGVCPECGTPIPAHPRGGVKSANGPIQGKGQAL